MKHLLYATIIGFLFLGACAPSQPTPTQTPAVPTPSLVPIDLAGPQMKVGSSFLYADGSLLVAVPAGTFTMGRQGGVDNPEHQVTLSDFWIYRTKVTNEQYAYCVATGNCNPPNNLDDPSFNDPLRANDPVVGVDYSQAAAYCGFVHARLPTEAEWEKTARGPDANLYPWGNGAPSCDLLNFESCVGKSTPVNTYPSGQSYYQAFDMEGNAFEWVADWYKVDYYASSPSQDPQGPDKSIERSVRSSAFNSGTDQTPTFTRFSAIPVTHRNNLGFRCVVNDPTYFAPLCNYPATYGTNGLGGGLTNGGVQVNCPNLTFGQTESCENGNPVTFVTLNGPPGSNFTAPQPPCTANPPGDPTHFVCKGNGQLSICSSCSVVLTSQPQCPAGYTIDPVGKNCVLQRGGNGQCLPGFTASTLGLHRGGVILTNNTPVPTAAPGSGGQCCTYDPGSAHFSSHSGNGVILGIPIYPSCPAGTWFDGQECISIEIVTPYCKSRGISLTSCKVGGGGGGNTCPNSCGQNYIQDPTTCQCICNGC